MDDPRGAPRVTYRSHPRARRGVAPQKTGSEKPKPPDNAAARSLAVFYAGPVAGAASHNPDKVAPKRRRVVCEAWDLL